MKPQLFTRIAVVLITGAFLMVPAARAQEGAGAVEQQVREAIIEFTTAYGTNDLDTYFSYYADDMTWWGPRGNRYENDGRTPKQNYMASYPGSVERTGGYASHELSDLRVQVSPNAGAAVASYRIDLVRKNPREGRSADVAYEMTTMLFKRGNDWRIVHFHYQTIPPPEPGS